MGKQEKTLLKVLSGTVDANINFQDLCHLLEYLGFEKRIRGSHYIFTKKEVLEILNIQSKQGKAKPYQVKQIRKVITEYGIAKGLL